MDPQTVRVRVRVRPRQKAPSPHSYSRRPGLAHGPTNGQGQSQVESVVTLVLTHTVRCRPMPANG